MLGSTGRFIRENAALLMVGIGGAGVAILAFVGLDKQVDVLWTTAIGKWVSAFTVLVVIGYVLQVAQQTSRVKIARELATERVKAAASASRLRARHKAGAECFREHLAAISKLCGFVATERISVYSHRANNTFRIVGRYSANGDFDTVRREVHEADQGIVARAFQKSDKVTYEFTHNPAENLEKYCEEHREKFNIKVNVVKKFKMKSLSYAAYPISDAKGTRCIAIVVCESTISGSLTNINTRFKIGEHIDHARPSLRAFVDAADTEDDYLLQTQIVNQ